MECGHFFRIGILVLVAVLATPIASAATIEVNGPTVISSPGTYVLTQDISANQGPAISIRSSNVIFDGRGYTIDGVDAGSSFGILVNNGKTPLTGVTVKNVRLTDWYDGLYFKYVDASRIESVTASSNVRAGISLCYANDNVLTGCTVNGNGQGMYVWSRCSRNRIESCTMSDNSETGLWLASTGRTANGIVYDSTDNRVIGNTASGNGRMGLYVDFSDGNILSNNRVTANKQFGIFLDYSTRTQVEDNAVSGGSEQAIYLYDADETALVGNTVSGAADYGIWISSSSGATIRSNAITKNGKGGLVLNGEETIPANDHTIVSNTIRDNGDVGLYLCRSAGNIIADNLFSNPANVRFGGACGGSIWSDDGHPGTSIVNGPTLGGNYWGSPSGTGFSEKTADANGDGICDAPYVINANNTDRLPLARSRGAGTAAPTATTSPPAQSTPPPIVLPSITPTATSTAGPQVLNASLPALPGAAASPRDADGDGRYEDVNGNGRTDFSDITLLFNNMGSLPGAYPVTAFDFNGNNRMDFADVTVLFGTL